MRNKLRTLHLIGILATSFLILPDTFMTEKSLLYRYPLIVIVGVTAILLLALSWPRLRASISYLPVDTAMSSYWKTRKTDGMQLNGLIERAKESIAIHDHYRSECLATPAIGTLWSFASVGVTGCSHEPA